MGGLVLAVIGGVLVPAAAVMLVAARDPVPRSCDSGQATMTTVDGAILYTGGADLWYSEGLPGKPRKLIDYAPARARPGATASPSARANPSPSPTVTAIPSGSPAPPTPRLLAADISADRKQVALLVLDPPDRPGSISLRLMSPLDPPGTSTAEAWYSTSPERREPAAARVQILANGRVLAFAPVATSALPTASPAPSAAPSAAPTGSPPATPASVAPAPAALLVAPSPRPAITGAAPVGAFLAGVYRAWPDATGYRPPPAAPRLQERVDGTRSVTAGVVQHSLLSPLVSRHIPVIALGRLGHPDVSLLCSVSSSARPAALSPDESLLAITDNGRTSLIDLSGLHAATPLVNGILLSWRS
jgi:hypothetical protein